VSRPWFHRPAGIGALTGWGAGPLGRLLARPGRERLEGYYTLVDQAGNVLLQTAITVVRGDLFIDEDDRVHRVIKVTGDTAVTEVAAEGADEAAVTDRAPLPDRRLWQDAAGVFAAPVPPPTRLGLPLGTARNVVVIYHTHSDESYTPTDGTSSVPGAGGVYDVGSTLAGALREKGFTVVHDLSVHDPHDAGAYPRSRRTVLRNLQFAPLFLFDVHRDSAPAPAYLTEIGGVETSRILIVVGGGNPLSRANLATARRLKLFADELFPTLIRGILVARGNYNQDLDPGAILLEMGTESIPQSAAERAAALWADVVAAFAGPPGPDSTPAPQ